MKTIEIKKEALELVRAGWKLNEVEEMKEMLINNRCYGDFGTREDIEEIAKEVERLLHPHTNIAETEGWTVMRMPNSKFALYNKIAECYYNKGGWIVETHSRLEAELIKSIFENR